MKTSEIFKIVYITLENGEPRSFFEKVGRFLLCRYVPEQHTGVVLPGSFWTEAHTDNPNWAAEATGIFEGDAVWRIELEVTAEELDDQFECGRERWSDVCLAREYQNFQPIAAERLVWTRLA